MKPNKEVILSAKQDSFSVLPEEPPYGFLVFPDGRFMPVVRHQGHSKLLKSLGTDMEKFLGSGGCSLTKISNVTLGYYIGRNTPFAKRNAVKSAKDICRFYKAAYEVCHATF